MNSAERRELTIKISRLLKVLGDERDSRARIRDEAQASDRRIAEYERTLDELTGPFHSSDFGAP